jgi:hypothetical protein
MRPLALALAVAVTGVAGPARAAPALTLNGVSIDGATGQRFENATVIIDEKGGVHIQAVGYAVKATGQSPVATAAIDQPGAPGRLSRRYFLVTEHAAPGTQFDLAVFINARWIREVKASEPQVVMEITRYLRPGTNKLVLAATKRMQEERTSTSPEVALNVVVGEGNVGGDHVMIDNPLVEARRTAAETQDRIEEYLLEAR